LDKEEERDTDCHAYLLFEIAFDALEIVVRVDVGVELEPRGGCNTHQLAILTIGAYIIIYLVVGANHRCRSGFGC
jgi:hypothetical protein